MTKRILDSIIIVSTVFVMITAFVLSIVLNRYFATRLQDEMIKEAQLIGRGAETSGITYFSTTSIGDLHVTWIDKNGSVIFDSYKKTTRDYSKERLFLEAKYFGEYRSSEYSFRTATASLEYSLKLRDGTVIYVSDVQISLKKQVRDIVRSLMISFVFLALTALILAHLVSSRILKPLNNLDLENPKIDKSLPELSPLLVKLNDQNIRISNQMYELRRSREQFEQITESMSEGIIVTDTRLNILSCNSGAVSLLGAEGKAEEGKTVFNLNNSDSFRRCLHDAAGGKHAEMVLNTPDGDREVIASPAYSSNVIHGVVVLIMDVTEKHQLETMRREFTSNVSHELKTPLTTIYGFSDLLSNGMVKPGDVQTLGENIRREAERLITLINDIVALSKLDENSVPAAKENVDLYELAEEVVRRLGPNAEKKNITASVSGERVVYNGCRTILDEIIYNLCDNAIKYGVEGGFVEVKLSHIPKKVLITVTDNGVGIPQQSIGRIFERFYRVDKSRSRKVNGTGLGLSIVKHGVIYHGGEIRCESTPGNGTEFTVELPVSPQVIPHR